MIDGPFSAASSDHVAELIRSHPRLVGWRFETELPGYLELSCDLAYLVLLWPERWGDPGELEAHVLRARSGGFGLVLFGEDDELVRAEVDCLDAPGLVLVPVPAPRSRVVVTLLSACDAMSHSRLAAALELENEQARYENDMLISVGRALSQSRDLDSLLALILHRAREVTGADAGSIYVVDGIRDDPTDDPTGRCLRCVASQNDSVSIESREFTMPVRSSSIVGTCVIKRRPINIPDLYDDNQGYSHDRSFDDKYGYQTRSLLTVPMISARQDVIGVIQLINKRARGFFELTGTGCFDAGVVPFDPASVNYAKSLGSQAGIALENALLYDEVRSVFEGFVRASVTAIESRDPTTSGHSERVADLTVGLARSVERVDNGPYAGLSFDSDELQQIEYAALLHDFGKVGVREHVLVKAKKLYTHERDLILARFDFIKKAIENEVLSGKVAYLLDASRDAAAAEMGRYLSARESELSERLREIDDFVRFILSANQPTVLESGGFERIQEIAARRYVDSDGMERAYLSHDEANALQVLRGSLTPREREEIESHVVHTYNFLRQIPWGRTFRGIPEIAGAHHEKLDGSGYPNALMAPDIPAPARMMTIADIYDALTASDRPYKKAMPTERALDILGYEVKDGRLDPDLYRLFIDARVYDLTRDS